MPPPSPPSLAGALCRTPSLLPLDLRLRYLVAKSDFVGSSGGVAALAGANCVLGIEQLATLWRHYRRTGHTPSLDTLVSTVAPLLPLLSYVQVRHQQKIRRPVLIRWFGGSADARMLEPWTAAVLSGINPATGCLRT